MRERPTWWSHIEEPCWAILCTVDVSDDQPYAFMACVVNNEVGVVRAAESHLEIYGEDCRDFIHVQQLTPELQKMEHHLGWTDREITGSPSLSAFFKNCAHGIDPRYRLVHVDHLSDRNLYRPRRVS